MMQKTKLQKKYTLRTKLKTSFEKKVSSFFFCYPLTQNTNNEPGNV